MNKIIIDLKSYQNYEDESFLSESQKLNCIKNPNYNEKKIYEKIESFKSMIKKIYEIFRNQSFLYKLGKF